MIPALPDGFELVVLSDFAHANGGAPAVALQTARGVAGANRVDDQLDIAPSK